MFQQLCPDRGWSFNAPDIVAAGRAIAYPEQNARGSNLAEAVRETGAKRVLLSYDALCGDPYANFGNRAALLGRLIGACDGLTVRVLLVVRRQADWIESIFRQSLHEYYFTPFRKFVMWPNNERRSGYPRVAVDACRWHEIAAGFADAVGNEAVTVLPYELLVRDVSEFVAQLSEFLETPLEHPQGDDIVNRGYGAVSVRIALALNPLLREKSRFGIFPNRPFYYALKARRHRWGYGWLLRQSSRLSLRAFLQWTVDRYFWSPPQLFDAGEKERVMTLCAESNDRLSKFCPVDLTRLGYAARRETANACDRSETSATR